MKAAQLQLPKDKNGDYIYYLSHADWLRYHPANIKEREAFLARMNAPQTEEIPNGKTNRQARLKAKCTTLKA